MPLLRIPKAMIRREIQTLIRTFPSETVRVTRRGGGTWNSEGDQTPDEVEIYRGEALVAPAGGMVTILGLGQIESKQPQMLISGSWPIEQGDTVLWGGRRYLVSFDPDYWQAFLLLTLQQDDATP